MKTWKPQHNPDHLVEVDDKGKPIRVIKGNKTLRQLLEENFDKKTDITREQNNKLRRIYNLKER